MEIEILYIIRQNLYFIVLLYLNRLIIINYSKLKVICNSMKCKYYVKSYLKILHVYYKLN